ncbi:hypothetical protein PRZ48_011604 [Zasmidium cellare]|uniref:Enoyl reductase (ER) domain-containing protein n=1 Tax=Zasmidium cellare TaxID=395010 RepID=A0ABR0E6W0_ZASCE|nr:hypothetical protein PRZ48_011604 [Zasmidium cellare]
MAPSRQLRKIPSTMTGVVLTGHGGLDKLEYRHDLKVPTPGPEEVLIQVAAAGINNTDINTRIGWYSKGTTTATEEAHGSTGPSQSDDATWSGTPLHFPRIQGADCCGYIVAVGSNVSPDRIGQRVLVSSILRQPVNYEPYKCWTFGSECDGGFAQYTTAPARDTYRGMLHRAKITAGETVVITGASGGVGLAAVQLVKRREARVIAVCGHAKAEDVRAAGADLTINRGDSIHERLDKNSVNVVVDLAAGPAFGELLDVLKRGGRYATAGAIAGPLVQLDVRTLYLKDLTFFGCTFQEDEVFANLIEYIERDEIRPYVGKTFPLGEIRAAQEHFLSKATCGKLVLEIPEAVAEEG